MIGEQMSERSAWFREHVEHSARPNPLAVNRGPAVDAVPLADAVALARPNEVVESVARMVQRIHATPVSDCPFETSPAGELASAQQRYAAGSFEQVQFDAPYNEQPASRMIDIAETFMPADFTSAVVHGSLELSSLVVVDGEVEVVGLAPLCGVGDPYQDLVYLAVALASAVGLAAAPALFDAYGIELPELSRVEFWTLMFQLRDRAER